MLRIVMAFALFGLLSACAVKPEHPFTDREIAAARFVADAPPEIVLYTMKNARGGGAHSALLVNASQRVIFDPAGSFRSETIPRRGDVVFGVTPHMLEVYEQYHSSDGFYIIRQRLPVAADTAEALLAEVLAAGRIPDAMCALSVSRALDSRPETAVGQTWFPNTLEDRFARLPGVSRSERRGGVAGPDSFVLAETVAAE